MKWKRTGQGLSSAITHQMSQRYLELLNFIARIERTTCYPFAPTRERVRDREREKKKKDGERERKREKEKERERQERERKSEGGGGGGGEKKRQSCTLTLTNLNKHIPNDITIVHDFLLFPTFHHLWVIPHLCVCVEREEGCVYFVTNLCV